MKIILFPILLFTAITVSGQSSELILTKEDNATWIKALEKEDLERQLKMLQKRWRQDKAYQYELSSLPHNIAVEDKVVPNCRPMYVFKGSGEQRWIMPVNPPDDVIAEVSKMMIPKHVSGIRVEDGTKMQAIYGLRGSCGVVTIKFSGNDFFKKIGVEGGE